MPDSPAVSILINNHNYGRFLARAIDSALGQTLPGVEVVVVDDGSTDESRHVIASYGGRVVAVLKPNGGQASAFNAGFAASRGDVVLLLDSDDWSEPDRAAKAAAAFARHPEAGWCFHPLRPVWSGRAPPAPGRGEGLPAALSGPVDFRGEVRRGHTPRFAPATSGLCFRRSLLARVLPMPEGKSVTISDHYLKYASVALEPGVCLPEALAVLRVHGHNHYTGTGDKRQHVEARINVSAAYWIARRFPELWRLADKLMGMGLGTFSRLGGVEPEYRPVALEYLASLPPRRRALVHLRAAYHGSKLLAGIRAYRQRLAVRNPLAASTAAGAGAAAPPAVPAGAPAADATPPGGPASAAG